MLRHGGWIPKQFPGVRRAVAYLPVRGNSQLIATNAANASKPTEIPPPHPNAEETEAVANTGMLNEKGSNLSFWLLIHLNSPSFFLSEI